MSTSASGPQWAAVRSHDNRPVVLKIVSVTDILQAQKLAAEQMAVYNQLKNEHLVRQHDAIALADGTLALVLDEASGGSLVQLLGARGQLSAGETVTTMVPLLGLLADLHAADLVHGDLAPGSVRFQTDGRPLIADLGVARLLGWEPGLLAWSGIGGLTASGFVAPELVGGAAPSAASDVYAIAAIGWFCLTGTSPPPAATPASLTALRPETPPGLVDVLISCLATDPAARPSAGLASIAVFDATPAESVALASLTDPAAEVTRRIRAAAVSVSDPTPRVGKRFQAPLVLGVVALLLAVVAGAGARWFFQRQQVALPAASSSATLPARQSEVVREVRPATQPPGTSTTVPTTLRPTVSPARVIAAGPQSPRQASEASSSPRMAPAELLQELVDARALAYVTRSSSLLDLVYAPGADRAGLDRENIATALKNGGTYLGLSFVIRDVAFLDGTTHAARIRATILTPAYKTGQPDGRKISHAPEILGPCIFSLSLTPDGWRLLGLTVI